jgi:septal ring factor EnvC (AmiA/AmiB activator)
MNIDKNDINIKELQKGIKMILEGFEEQKKQYIAIINSMNEKIDSLEQQINKLKEENSLYQNKLRTLQKNIKCISKSICDLKDDEILINDENKKNEILDKEIKNNNLMENENYLELLKEKNKANDSFRIHKNKFEIMKNKNTNHINKFFNDFNYYMKDEGNIENRQDKVYMKAINKILNNKIKKDKSDLKKMNNKAINENIKYFEKKEKDEINNENDKNKSE